MKALDIYVYHVELITKYVVNVENGDGWGVMWAKDNKIQIRKGIEKNDFWKIVKECKYEDVTYHLRFATHGDVNIENCHPFQVTDNVWMAHNGIINVPEIDTGMSDSYNWSKYVLGPILKQNEKLFGTMPLKEMVQAMIGSYNKIVLLKSNGEKQIINQSQGIIVDEIWYSNDNLFKYLVPYGYIYGSSGISKSSDAKEEQYYYDVICNDESEAYSACLDPETLIDLMSMPSKELGEYIRSNPLSTARMIKDYDCSF
jgi:hypothetical protein